MLLLSVVWLRGEREFLVDVERDCWCVGVVDCETHASRIVGGVDGERRSWGVRVGNGECARGRIRRGGSVTNAEDGACGSNATE
jgi:hypothetical protein